MTKPPQDVGDDAGQFRGHQRAEPMAFTGQFCWPSVGTNQCHFDNAINRVTRWEASADQQGAIDSGQ